MRTKYSYKKKEYKYNFGNPNVFVIREREKPNLIKKYDDNIQKLFNCNLHGNHSEWQITKVNTKSFGVWMRVIN